MSEMIAPHGYGRGGGVVWTAGGSDEGLVVVLPIVRNMNIMY